jgi:hypothetical protein
MAEIEDLVRPSVANGWGFSHHCPTPDLSRGRDIKFLRVRCLNMQYDFSEMKTLFNMPDRKEVLDRLSGVRPESERRWGSMSAHQMICHLSDSFRAALGEKRISKSTTLFKRTIYKWVALWLPFHWPHGIMTRPEMDQHLGGTPPAEFISDLEKLRILLDRFCNSEGEFAPHATLGQMSRTERMRHAYLHIDHHLRQFGV